MHKREHVRFPWQLSANRDRNISVVTHVDSADTRAEIPLVDPNALVTIDAPDYIEIEGFCGNSVFSSFLICQQFRMFVRVHAPLVLLLACARFGTCEALSGLSKLSITCHFVYVVII